MDNNESTRLLLLEHCKKYPSLEIRDVFKFLYQSSFGCEHAAADEKTVRERIISEYESVNSNEDIEMLDGDYFRLPLSYLKKGLSAATLARLFCLSAVKEENRHERLSEKLSVLKDLTAKGTLPFESESLEGELKEWEKQGYPSVSHTETFKREYSPSYRVISKRFMPFLTLFTEIDRQLENGQLMVAVEGGSASGKTTLAELLSKIYDCTVFHMDDFFLRPEQRTSERMAEVGGNVDRERFLCEVLLPLSRGDSVCYRKMDCSTMTVGKGEIICPKKLVITEGAYSMHPELASYYDLSVFLYVSPELQRERVIKRNGETFAQRFFKEWIPMETEYFEKTDIKSRCDIVIDTV